MRKHWMTTSWVVLIPLLGACASAPRPAQPSELLYHFKKLEDQRIQHVRRIVNEVRLTAPEGEFEIQFPLEARRLETLHFQPPSTTGNVPAGAEVALEGETEMIEVGKLMARFGELRLSEEELTGTQALRAASAKAEARQALETQATMQPTRFLLTTSGLVRMADASTWEDEDGDVEEVVPELAPVLERWLHYPAGPVLPGHEWTHEVTHPEAEISYTLQAFVPRLVPTFAVIDGEIEFDEVGEARDGTVTALVDVATGLPVILVLETRQVTVDEEGWRTETRTREDRRTILSWQR